MNKVFSLFGLCCFCISFSAKTQGLSLEASDSAFYQHALANVIVWYENTVGANSPLYKGKEYLDYNFRTEGDQYFQSDLWQKGAVYYDGQLYQEVSMKYDIANNVLIVDHPHLPSPVSLESNKIGHFSLLGHHFIRLVADSLSYEVIKTGFYDLVYDGDVKFLVNRAKTLRDEIEGKRIRYWFEEADRYFIKVDHTFYKLKNKRSVLKLFPEQKREIKQLLKRNDIKFRRQPEEALRRIVMYIDQEEI